MLGVTLMQTGQREGGFQLGHLREVPPYCLEDDAQEFPSPGAQVEYEEGRDHLNPGELQEQPEEHKERGEGSQPQHLDLRGRESGDQLLVLTLTLPKADTNLK